MEKILFVAALAFALTACSSNPGASSAAATPTQGPNVLTASPSSLYFAVTFDPPSQSVAVSGARPFDSNFAISVADPTVVGYAPPTINGASANVSVFAVAPGSTAVSFLDGGGTATISTSSDQPCGRPSNLFYTSKQIVPTSGTASVPANIGTIYFAVYSTVTPSAKLHMIVGAHESFEAGSLVATSLPAGTPTAAPQSGAILTYMRATLPMLASGTSYRTQLVSDTCESPLIAGSFST